MKNVSLHIRAEKKLELAFAKAFQMSLKFFQCFLLDARTKKYFDMDEEADPILKNYRQFFEQLIFHGSYFVNLTQENYDELYNLKKELQIAQKLEFTHAVFHPGSKSNLTSQQAQDRLVKNINLILKHFPNFTVIIENSAHGGNAFGGDILEFKDFFKNIDRPEKVKFCIDTAHAYSFGYDITNDAGINSFVSLLEQIFTPDQIGLIHLNDTDAVLGQKIDKHSTISQGKIGPENLKKIINSPILKNSPIILELPEVEIEKEEMLLKEIRNWR